MGMQRPIELSPERRICIQQELDLVKIFGSSVKKSPISMDVNGRWPGSFPNDLGTWVRRNRVLSPLIG